jgi:hypothetical protein
MHPEAPREKNICCKKCDKTFLTKYGYEKHFKIEHENGRIEFSAQCDLCTSIFSDKHKLQRHIHDIHEDRRRYSCHLCNQMFKRPSHLKNHIVRHDNPNRRKRGPQKPMLKGGKQLLNFLEQKEAEAITGLENDTEEAQAEETPSPTKEVIISTTTPTLAYISSSTSDNNAQQQQRVQIHRVVTVGQATVQYTTIDQNIVKDFSMSYLQ